MLNKFKVRRGCTVPNTLSWPFTKNFDGTEMFATTGWLQRPAGDPVCRDPFAHGHNMGFISRGFLPPMGAAGERPEYNIKAP